MKTPLPDRWQPFIDQIERAEGLPEKFGILAMMVRLLAENDLVALENQVDELGRKFDKCMKKIYAIGVVIAVLAFTGINIKTIVDLILRIAK